MSETEPVAPAAPIDPRPVLMRAGSRVDLAHVAAAELPEELVRRLGTDRLDEDLFGADDVSGKDMHWEMTEPRVRSRFNAGYLRVLVKFLENHGDGVIDVEVERHGPILLTTTYHRVGPPGKPGEDLPIRIAIAPKTMEEEE